MSINKVILIGHVGNIDVREVGNDKKAQFTLATSEKFKNRTGAVVETTEWHSIEVWGRLAEVAEKYICKGSKVYVEGKIKTEKYTDKEGHDKYLTKILANNIQLLDRKQNGDDDLPE